MAVEPASISWRTSWGDGRFGKHWLERGLIISVFLYGCGLFTSQEPPSVPATIVGTITGIQWEPTPGALQPPIPNVLIEEDPGSGVGNKAFVGFSGASIFVRTGTGPWQKGTTQDLAIGVHAEAWIKDMLTSYPGMGTAEQIAVTQP